MQEYLKKYSSSISRQEMADQINSKFELDLNVGHIKRAYKQFNLKGMQTRFGKGHIPANKGKKVIPTAASIATQFKKGSKPHTWLPVGSERMLDGYIQVKVTDTGYPPKDWVQKQRIVWEQHHNKKIPEKHTIRFIDGDKANLSPENLLLVSRAEACVMNRWLQINDLPEDGLVTVHLLAKLKIAATKVKKRSNECN